MRRPIATIAEDIIRCHDAALEEEPVETEDLASKFMFFAKFEDRQKESEAAPRKVFRITPPRDSAQGVGAYGEDLVVPVLKNKCAAPNCSVCKLRVGGAANIHVPFFFVCVRFLISCGHLKGIRGLFHARSVEGSV